MTPAEASPYPLSAIRPFLAIACLALFGCVTDVVTRSEHAELLSSIRALRAENARLEGRLDRLEAERPKGPAAARAPVLSPQAIAARPGGAADALPPLTVVKLKPR